LWRNGSSVEARASASHRCDCEVRDFRALVEVVSIVLRVVRSRGAIDTMTHMHTTLVAVAALMVGACQSPEPQSPTAGLTKPVDPPQPPDLGRSAGSVEILTTYSMYVDEGVRSVCAGPDPYFSFSSATPTPHDQATMKVLADCMMSGPLRMNTILLVGRTDPRGTENYNAKLGLERAEKVKSFLVSQGVDQMRVRTTSLGKDDASPIPSEWAGDRRVEVKLGP
jgi:outer membrane protein OmpA-like peptidoglycan-associated protein